MDITLTEEQKIIKTAAHDFLERECPKSLVREIEKSEKGYSPQLWGKMAEIGWLGMLFPEEYGGSAPPEGSLLNMAIIMEEAGYAGLPSPLMSSVVQSGLLVLEAGNEEQKRRFLPGIARGELLMALALTEPNAGFGPAAVTVKAAANSGGFIIDGVKLFVSDAYIADFLVCAARTRDGATPRDGITLFIVDNKNPAVEHIPLQTTAGDRQYEVAFHAVRVSRESILGELDQGWAPLEKVLERATILKCAEMVGGAQAALDMTVAYAKKRVQFNKPIGSFQAVHHHCADMYKDVVASRLLTYHAAWRLNAGFPAGKEVSLAKARLSAAYPAVTRMAHQIHGGVAFHTDYPLELYYRRATASQVTLGDADYHRELIANYLGL